MLLTNTISKTIYSKIKIDWILSFMPMVPSARVSSTGAKNVSRFSATYVKDLYWTKKHSPSEYSSTIRNYNCWLKWQTRYILLIWLIFSNEYLEYLVDSAKHKKFSSTSYSRNRRLAGLYYWKKTDVIRCLGRLHWADNQASLYNGNGPGARLDNRKISGNV